MSFETLWNNWFKNEKLNKWGQELCIKALEKMSDEYSIYLEELVSGLVKRVVPGLGSIPNYYGFTYNTSLSKKYERNSEPNFALEGFILRNNKGQEESLSIYFAHGLITGFSIESKIDITDVQVISDKVRKYFKHSYEKLPKEIQKIINSYPKINISDVYIVEIGDRIIYHLTDIEDGDSDFIGYEFTKGFVKVYHDPVSINLVADISEYF